MFKSLFKPKWQSAKPQVRIQALQLLDINNSEDARIIELMAKGDVEPEVRIAAIKRIGQRDKLLALINQEKDPKVRAGAVEQLVVLLPAVNAENDSGQVRQVIEDLDVSLIASIVEHTQNVNVGCVAIEALTDESVLETMACRLPVAQLRQAAAQKLTSEPALERVLKASKGKDKGVWRICKESLNSLREAQQHEATIEQQINEICHGLETLSRLPYDNLYVAKVEHLQKQWQRLQHHSDNGAVQRFNRAYALCKATIDDIHNEQHRLAEENKLEREALQERIAACELLEDALKRMSDVEVALEPSDIPAMQALLKTQKTRWDEAASVVEPAADERKRFSRVYELVKRSLDSVRAMNERGPRIEQAAEAILALSDATMATLLAKRKQLKAALGDLVWPDELPWPASLKLHQQALEHWDRLEAKAKVLEQEAIQTIKTRLNELAAEIEQGHLKPANRILKETQQLIKHLPMKAASAYQKQLRELTANLNELRDWQGFAATPKKEQLCEAMEGLINSEEDPQALATKIRRLQDEWREIGEADPGRDRELWNRFKAAADEAYEPCKEYFDKLAALRKANLEQRQLICQQLSTYLQQYDWENADWLAVNQVYETAKSEWRLYTPVERKDGKQVQDQFNVLLDQLREKIQSEFKRNKAQREALITAVEALLEEENVGDAINKAKELQQQWRATGQVSRRDDARLWKRFRAECDKVFARRDQERQEQAKAREQNLVHGEHLCEQIEQLAESHFSDAAEAEQDFRTLQQRFSELTALPREQQTELQNRYRDVCKQFKERLAVVQNAQRVHSINEMWRRAAICDELETLALSGGSETEVDVSPDAQWEGDMDLPAEVDKALSERFNQAQELLRDGTHPELETLKQNGEKLRDLCIKLEIAAGVDSPDEDRHRRMTLQVDRLSDGLSQRADAKSYGLQIEQLQMDWCQLGPTIALERAQLSQRFKAVLNQVNKKSQAH